MADVNLDTPTLSTLQNSVTLLTGMVVVLALAVVYLAWRSHRQTQLTRVAQIQLVAAGLQLGARAGTAAYAEAARLLGHELEPDEAPRAATAPANHVRKEAPRAR